MQGAGGGGQVEPRSFEGRFYHFLTILRFLPHTGLKRRRSIAPQQAHHMNTSRTTESQVPSPATGARARLGHVVRWNAEPIVTESSREGRENAESEGRSMLHVVRPR